MKYEASRESVTAHKVPRWYQDAKFGIFIHWGLYSVPGYAWSEKGKSIRDIHMERDPFEGQRFNPYAEWYLNSLRIEGSPTQEYHARHYGADFSYFDFQKEFEKKSARMDPAAWADLFQKAGAKYVVMVTKHHDGYCLWPSEYQNPMLREYQSSRDLVGEVTHQVREKGLKMGLYYSGIFDWSFKTKPMNSPSRWVDHYLTTDEYAEYAYRQTEELIRKYHPSVLWNDMGYPGACDLDRLFADYYNQVPEGVTNERWIQRHLPEGMTLEEYTTQLEKNNEVMRLDDGIHGDFMDPEYIDIHQIPSKKWEQTRGIGMSFGYNRAEDPANFLTGKEMIFMLADTVSMNGNLLMNVGPMADGTIQKEQVQPLLETGGWLRKNGEAIYGTTYWKIQRTKTTAGHEVRFTKKEDVLYAIIFDETPGGKVVIQDLPLQEGSRVTLLGGGNLPVGKTLNGGIEADLPENIDQMACVLRIEQT